MDGIYHLDPYYLQYRETQNLHIRNVIKAHYMHGFEKAWKHTSTHPLMYHHFFKDYRLENSGYTVNILCNAPLVNGETRTFQPRLVLCKPSIKGPGPLIEFALPEVRVPIYAEQVNLPSIDESCKLIQHFIPQIHHVLATGDAQGELLPDVYHDRVQS